MTARLEVWQGPDRLWRWRYLQAPSPGGGHTLELLGNKHYPARELAVHAATTAYPEMAVRLLDGPTATPSGARQPGRYRRVIWWVAFAVLVAWPLVRRPARGTQ